jgi:hypothetical protein
LRGNGICHHLQLEISVDSVAIFRRKIAGAGISTLCCRIPDGIGTPPYLIGIMYWPPEGR